MRTYINFCDDNGHQFHLTELSAWYEGEATNNGPERHNLAYKERKTIRKRLSLREFLQKAETAIHRWSTNPDYQVELKEIMALAKLQSFRARQSFRK